MSDAEYKSAEEQTIALADAEAASRRAESELAIARSLATQQPNGGTDFKAAFREALKEEIDAREEEARIRNAEVARDLSGTAPTLSDSAGNFAPNPEVANAGGTGVDASNTNPETGKPAETAEEAGKIVIPADWEGSHWRTRVALAEKISGRDDVKAEDANGIIADELARRG